MSAYQNRISLHRKNHRNEASSEEPKFEEQIELWGTIEDDPKNDVGEVIRFSLRVFGIEHHFLVPLPESGEKSVMIQAVDWEDKPLFTVKGLVKSSSTNPKNTIITCLLHCLFQPLVVIVNCPPMDDEDTEQVPVYVKPSDMPRRRDMAWSKSESDTQTEFNA
jgi:hypothetical protein